MTEPLTKEEEQKLMAQHGITYDAEHEYFVKQVDEHTQHRTTSLEAMLTTLGIDVGQIPPKPVETVTTPPGEPKDGPAGH